MGQTPYFLQNNTQLTKVKGVFFFDNMILIVSFLNCIQEKNMKGQVRGQGKVKQILWWPAFYK